MLKRLAAVLLATALVLPAPLVAGEAGDLTRTHLYGGSLQAGLDALAPLQQAGDTEAMFGTALLRFVAGLETLAQSLHRHGLAAPDGGDMGPSPLLLPVPSNPDPEPLDYAKVRALLARLVQDLDAARSDFEQAAGGGDYVVPLDLLQFRIDMNGDGRAVESESIGGLLVAAQWAEGPPVDASSAAPERRPARPGERPAQPPVAAPEAAAAPAELVVGFDRADAFWLAGYSQVIAAQADFLLAHDFEETVDAVFHRLFPRAGLPMQAYSEGGMLMFDPESDSAIADVVAAVHTIDWPVVEPERLAGVSSRLQAVTALSRRNWEAILAETDDNAELVPSPRQTAIVPEGVVTDEMVTAWLETLDVADRILSGDLLVPHWRFRQGVDLAAYFGSAERTDLVMLLTGYDALPFLRDGPVATPESFAAANRVFGDQLLGYAFWFN